MRVEHVDALTPVHDQGALLFVSAVMTVQILVSVVFTIFVVFRAMGSDYEATVMSAGFGGISLGSTATAIATWLESGTRFTSGEAR